MMAQERVHDTFCWKCCGDNAKAKCSRCTRSWHYNCVIKQEEGVFDHDIWVCMVCFELEQCHDTPNMLLALPTLMRTIRYKKWCPDRRRSLHNRSHLIVNPVDLQKKDWKNYESLREFYADIEWIFHNSKISFSSDKPEQIEKAASLLKNVSEEIDEIRKCPECYIRRYNKPKTWFQCVCNEPHLIVWAKEPARSSYWPAKVMGVVEEQQVKVQFFETHSSCDVPAAECYLYSENAPKDNRRVLNECKIAMKFAKEYIKNIHAKFGSFKYFRTKTELDPTQLDKYVEKMIPGIVAIRQMALNKIEEATNIDDNINSEDNLLRGLSTMLPEIVHENGSSPIRAVVNDFVRPFLSQQRYQSCPAMSLRPHLSSIAGCISAAMENNGRDDDEATFPKRRRTDSPILDERSESLPENQDISHAPIIQNTAVPNSIPLSVNAQKVVQEFEKNQKDGINILVTQLQAEYEKRVQTLNDEIKNLNEMHSKEVSDLKEQNSQQEAKIAEQGEMIEQMEHENTKMKVDHLKAIELKDTVYQQSQTEYAKAIQDLKQKHEEDKSAHTEQMKQKFQNLIAQMQF